MGLAFPTAGVRLIRLLDVVAVVWVVLWVALALLVGREVRNLRELSDTVVTAGVASRGDGRPRPQSREHPLRRGPGLHRRRPGRGGREERPGERTRQPGLHGEPQRPPGPFHRPHPDAAPARPLSPAALGLDERRPRRAPRAQAGTHRPSARRVPRPSRGLQLLLRQASRRQSAAVQGPRRGPLRLPRAPRARPSRDSQRFGLKFGVRSGRYSRT